MFQPENDIERALMRASADPAERPGFARDIIDADIFVVLLPEAGALVPDENGKAGIPEGSKLTLASVRHGDEEVLPFFTAASRARAIFHGDHIVAPDVTRDFFKRNPDRAFLLNPGSDYGKEFSRSEASRLLAGNFGEDGQTVVIEEPANVLLGMPKQIPDALIAALGHELGALKTVLGAWLMLAKHAGETNESWMLGVDHKGEWRDVQEALKRAVRGDVLRGRFLDAVPINENSLGPDLRAGIPVIAAKRGFFSKLFR
ncbi:enhanced serine sensitivity protein SseB C-terminal domain-containing protein [Tardiphaga sp. 813_E8_N1_3]|uniref:enhanced serine sensitivity protein SseB C-terminal domain-containing protein n=1 Tax=Tardiphaga sp. 813_E8_N1_3 TaxID=3240760 RepID=UPI003F238540